MTAFLALVRKEARENALVLAILAALMLVAAGSVAVVDFPGVRSAALPGIVAAVGVLGVALTIAPSLIPAETGDGPRLLGRLPLAPRTVFAAKATFLVASAAAVGAFGFAAAFAGQRAWSISDPTSAFLGGSTVVLAAAPLVFGFWLMTITCVVPRPLGAIPSGAVAFALIGAPIWWAFQAPLRPATAPVIALCVLAALAPLAAAYLGFRRLISGRGFGRTVLCVAAALAGFVLPAWAWSGWERWRWENLDIADPSAEITDAYLSVDGSRAYLNVRNTRRTDWMPYSFVVDLARGEVIGRGGPGTNYTTLQSVEHGIQWPTLATHETLVRWTREASGMELVDCATGRSRVVPAGRRPSEQFPYLLAADQRASAARAAPVGLPIEPPSVAGCEGTWHPRYCFPLCDAGGRMMLLVRKEGRIFLASYDEKSGDLAIATGDSDGGGPFDRMLVPLEWDGAEVIVLARGKRIERLRFGTSACEVLFPRE